MNQYIYIRHHWSYTKNNVVKLGETSSIIDRDCTYATGENIRGTYLKVILVKNSKAVERLLQIEFKKYKYENSGGTELYGVNILDLIECYLTHTKIKHHVLTIDEMGELRRKERVNKIFKKINKKSLINTINIINNSLIKYVPKDYQTHIIDNSIEYYKTCNAGILIVPCGVGKTLISLWISKALKCRTLLIGVPNKLLLYQWKNIVKHIYLFVPILLVKSGTTKDDIDMFIKNNKDFIIITTYRSSIKINNEFVFDIKIYDEMHHLTSCDKDVSFTKNKKTFVQVLKIKCKKQLGLTATIKYLENKNVDDISYISNCNKDYFGNIIDKKCVLWAIQNNIICDYVVQIVTVNPTNINIDYSMDTKLQISAYVGLNSIISNNTHHILIYANSTINSTAIIECIKKLIVSEDNVDVLDNLYFSAYNSKDSPDKQNEILYKFNNSKYGIISCVYCLSEGYDNPLIDGIVFGETMGSNIRIVQSALRAARLNRMEKDKITKIMLPVIQKKNWLTDVENSDYKMIKEVVKQMGVEDKTIEQKIKICDMIAYNKHKKSKKHVKTSIVDVDAKNKYLMLKTIKRDLLNIPFDLARQIVKELNIKSKDEYLSICDNDIRLTDEPEIYYKTSFINWIHYLGIEQEFYDYEMCVKKCNEYFKLYPMLKKSILGLDDICKKLCELDDNFPPAELWEEYYRKSLNKIIIITFKKKYRG